jgi:hypothetical protein
VGYYVAVTVSFGIQDHQRVAQLAGQTVPVAARYPAARYTALMLANLRDEPEKYTLCGNKGDLLHWGGVWNNYNFSDEKPLLVEFFRAIYRDEQQAIFDHDRALVLVNPEQSGRSYLYQFRYDDESGDVAVESGESPLSWNQH